MTELRNEVLNRRKMLALGCRDGTFVGGVAYMAFKTWHLLTPRGVCVQCLF